VAVADLRRARRSCLDFPDLVVGDMEKFGPDAFADAMRAAGLSG
jgi:hypothetical protein